MPTPIEQLITNLQNKLNLLRSRHELMREVIESREAEISELTKALEMERRKTSELSQQVEYLQVVHSVSPRREDAEQTRVFLTGLVREIDKCIADLSD